MNGTETISSHAEFQSLVERHARPLFRLAYRISGSEAEAEDLVQETFLKAWRQRDKFDGRASFGTWLHRICANCSLDHLRYRRRRQDSGSPDSNSNEDENPMDRVPAAAPSPERLALSDEINRTLQPALAELSEMERTAFVLRHYEGMPIEEIAVTLGVHTGAARHSVFRAVQKLRRALEPVASLSGRKNI